MRRANPERCTTSSCVAGVGGASVMALNRGGENATPAPRTYSRVTAVIAKEKCQFRNVRNLRYGCTVWANSARCWDLGKPQYEPVTTTRSESPYDAIAAFTSLWSTPPPFATFTHAPAVVGRTSAVTTAVTPTPRRPLTATSSHSALDNILVLAADKNVASSASAHARSTSPGSTTSRIVKLNLVAPSPAARSLSGSSATSATATCVCASPKPNATASLTTSRRKSPAARSGLKFAAAYPCNTTTGAQACFGRPAPAYDNATSLSRVPVTTAIARRSATTLAKVMPSFKASLSAEPRDNTRFVTGKPGGL
mmetsp:Transcript_2625/g.9211  ORF Transcript_2625/g.9211 Transcript_2625/m.9211 type:complete len:310 (+) Transcript_2625:5181-6110(+)